MADDKKDVGEPDRSLVAGRQDYEVQHFAEKFGLSAEQVRELIARGGKDRDKLEEAAMRMKSRNG